jgi:quercetin dioxygenase-like cupin family protein
MQNIRAEVCLPTKALPEDIGFFSKKLGMRLERIHPADDPRVAVVAGHGLRIRLEKGDGKPGDIRILADDPVLIAGGETALISPGGTRIAIEPLDPPVIQPPTEHAFVVRRLADGAPWVVGRAGMEYRDLVPGRLGGAMIASHIRIPTGGPVPDMVHYHKVGFQLIFCIRGWVDVVYEDQGGTRRLHPGDCFVQPPEIRHRVLHASDGIEVIEIGVPAEHFTIIDHDMALPTPHDRPDREFGGQRFVHNVASGAAWTPARLPGFVSRDTTVAHNTKDVAAVTVLRPGEGAPQTTEHDADILFSFVMSGGITLEGEGAEPRRLEPGDAFVIPPGMRTRYADPTGDLELLEVALPGRFRTSA